MRDARITCSLCGNSSQIVDAESLGWDWFTGYLRQRFVVCDKCYETNRAQVARMRHLSTVPVPVPDRSAEREARNMERRRLQLEKLERHSARIEAAIGDLRAATHARG